ncbi:CAP domain-containing protein [Salinispora arenicola]|uniref:CAP domain-containing protein n=1 Tax=Salinispora arenicola TaxID=168697 RepID=UPI00207A4915|nr:CAP domain-containing protein [Salinispora arenicola]MCN0152615.1 CAP domain-containing protein [Salinispora arenicola]
MYGWNDPRNPDGTHRQPEPTANQPAWLTDRPEPRSSYLFGDEPEQPAEEPKRPTDSWGQPTDGSNRHTDSWHRPTDGWSQQQPATHRQPDAGAQSWGSADDPYRGPVGGRYPEQPTPSWGANPTWQHGGPTDPWRQEHPSDGHRQQPGGWQNEPTGEWHRGATPSGEWHRAATPTGGPEHTDRWRPHQTTGGYADTPTTRMPPVAGPSPTADVPTGDGPPAGRRNRRPLFIGGAAAAATLVVSLGVGAVTLIGGDDTRPTSAAEDIVATNPTFGESSAPATPTTTASPSATPASPSPSATPSRKPAPAPSRSTAASRPTPARTTTSPAGSNSTPPSGNISADAAKVVSLVNAERAKAGCKALSVDDKLMTAAQRHSQDQADNKKMTHTGSNGSTLGDRVKAVGYRFRAAGENVAWNQQSPEAVMNAWMNSSGHRANILNCSFTEIGVGIASSNGPYWTQVFAAPL